MASWILLIIVLLVFIVLGTWFWGTVFGRGEVLEPIDDPVTVREDNRRAVAESRRGDIRFELVTRGYRPEQVDDVIADLVRQLEQAKASRNEVAVEKNV